MKLKTIINMKQNIEVVLSLFDGMGCLAIALKELGIIPDKYYSSEIDKFANKQTLHNFPDIIQLGDINNWKQWDIDWKSIDLVGAGSPCQGFSFAGKQLAFDDPRSKLFFVFVEILNHIKKLNPDVKFLLENVRMKKEHLRIMSEYVGVFPCSINSNLVSAQNRFRYYWTNIRTKKVGLFDELYTDIPQPKDQGIFLKDILQPESEIDKKYFLSEKLIKGLLNHAKNRNQEFKHNASDGKAKCITVSHLKSNLESNYIATGKVRALTTELAHGTGFNLTPQHAKEIRAAELENRICLTPKRTEYGKKIRKDYESGKIKEQRKNIQQLEPREDGKTNTISTVQKDNLLIVPEATKKGYTEIEPGDCVDLENPTSKTRKGRKMADKSNCMMSAANHFYKYTEDYRLRRLTPIECARLQTVPEWYEWVVSDTQIYKMLGNGWTIKKIMHILSFINLKS